MASAQYLSEIPANSLLTNRLYQFMVYMENRRNSSMTTNGYLLVKVIDIRSYMVSIA